MKNRRKYTTVISSGGVSIMVNFEDVKVGGEVLADSFMKKYIPGLEIGKNNKTEVVVNFVKRKVFFQFDTYPKINIGSTGLSIKDIISLIELVLERARQEKGIYCIHSASVIYKNKAVIFWGGATGMGKTRLVEEMSKQGGSFYSDEKTLIDLNKMKVMGGIQFQFLDKEFWKKQIKNQSKDSYYRHNSEHISSLPIGLFVYGFGIDGAKTSSERWSPIKFEWHMYEELGRKIRSISRRIMDGKKSVPAIDTQTNADRRIRFVHSLSNTIPCYSIQGSVINVVKKTKNLAVWN